MTLAGRSVAQAGRHYSQGRKRKAPFAVRREFWKIFPRREDFFGKNRRFGRL
jgi:hypothetical protein